MQGRRDFVRRVRHPWAGLGLRDCYGLAEQQAEQQAGAAGLTETAAGWYQAAEGCPIFDEGSGWLRKTFEPGGTRL